MSDSPEGVPHAQEQPVLVSIPEMPDRLEAAGLRKLTTARIRQLAGTDAFPDPVYTRGRLRLWLWPAVEAYFRDRKLTPGARTDLEKKADDGG
ncbi:hypothetical protein [Streptomyces kronopolitis]|uniref:hypothetical protein n=1 Tax=Streptomyces kronopolitis TaxID=1612435 RepID=UPI003D98DB51